MKEPGYWEETYRAGHRELYPWDCVVSFVFRAAPRNVPRDQVNILEVGFGTGSNLRFAAREGFSVAGVEMSATAVDVARELFSEEGLEGDLRVGDFTALPFENADFDLIIDRAALSCSRLDDIAQAIGEIARVAKPGAKFFFNPYADSHTSARSGQAKDLTLRVDIDAGSLAGLDRISFLSANDVSALLAEGWAIESMKRLEMTEMCSPEGDIHSEWRVIARRI